jgi:hypothetical protein
MCSIQSRVDISVWVLDKQDVEYARCKDEFLVRSGPDDERGRRGGSRVMIAITPRLSLARIAYCDAWGGGRARGARWRRPREGRAIRRPRVSRRSWSCGSELRDRARRRAKAAERDDRTRAPDRAQGTPTGRSSRPTSEAESPASDATMTSFLTGAAWIIRPNGWKRSTRGRACRVGDEQNTASFHARGALHEQEPDRRHGGRAEDDVAGAVGALERQDCRAHQLHCLPLRGRKRTHSSPCPSRGGGGR